MLSRVYLGNTYLPRQEIDLHRHATVSCAIAKFVSRLASFFKRTAEKA